MLINWWVKSRTSLHWKFLEIIPPCSTIVTCILKLLFQPMKGSEDQKPKKCSMKSKSSTSKLDFSNVPEKVKWVLTDTSLGFWAPFIGDEKVSESTMQEWSTAFTVLASRDNDQRKSWRHFQTPDCSLWVWSLLNLTGLIFCPFFSLLQALSGVNFNVILIWQPSIELLFDISHSKWLNVLILFLGCYFVLVLAFIRM